MRVYKTSLLVDDYRSLVPKDPTVHEKRLLTLDGFSKAAQWPEALEAVFDRTEHEDAPMPDIVSCGAGNIVLWGRSLDLLAPRFSKNCELLPVRWDGGSGCLVNVIDLCECLDEEQTAWCWDEDSGKRLFIEQYEFISENIPETLLFKISDQRFATFAADHSDGVETLMSLVTYSGFTGLGFDCVWEGD